MMNENHDYEIYSKEYGLNNMLNGDGIVINFTDKIPFDDFMFFARPTLDTKSFSGQVFTQESWREYVETCRKNDAVNLIQEETKILVSPLKNIQQEVRCWVVGGKVITASRYKLGNYVTYENYDNESFYVDFAQKMVDKYQPADCFVLDVCLADDELKIVEVNCINCAGFYDLNLYKLIEALENFYS